MDDGFPEHRRVRRRLAILVAAAVILAMGLALRSQGRSISSALRDLHPAFLLLGLLASVAYRVINAYGWSLVLQAMGQRMGGAEGIRIWLMSESLRWLPGSVWGFGSRAALAVERGVPAVAAAASTVLELLLTVLAWAIVALGGWGMLPDPALRFGTGPGAPALNGGVTVGALALALVLVAGLLRTRRFRGRLVTLLGQLRSPTDMELNPRGLILALAFYILMGIFNGVVFLGVLEAVRGDHGCPVRAVVAANALAWLAGFFAIMAPGGLIVREGCLVALLTAWIPCEAAVVAALTWRSLQILAEIVCTIGLVAPAILKTFAARAATSFKSPTAGEPVVSVGQEVRG